MSHWITLNKEEIANDEGYVKLKSIEMMKGEEEIDYEKIKVERYLSRGSHASVYECSYKGRRLAVKFTASSNGAVAQRDALTVSKNEAWFHMHYRIVDGPQAPHVVKLIATGELRNRNIDLLIGQVLIFEYCDGGDFDSLMNNLMDRRVFLPEPLIWNFLIAATTVLDGLSKPAPRPTTGKPMDPVFHCDLKPDNIMLKFPDDDPEGEHSYPILKLGDLGVARFGRVADNCAISRTGGAPFNAPEWKGYYHSPKSELWALVHIIYCATTMIAPARPRLRENETPDDPFAVQFFYRNSTMRDPCAGVIVHRIPNQYSDELQAAFELLLKEEPDDRPTPGEALEYLESVGARDRAQKFVKLPRECFWGQAEREEAGMGSLRGGEDSVESDD